MGVGVFFPELFNNTTRSRSRHEACDDNHPSRDVTGATGSTESHRGTDLNADPEHTAPISSSGHDQSNQPWSRASTLNFNFQLKYDEASVDPMRCEHSSINAMMLVAALDPWALCRRHDEPQFSLSRF